MFDFLRNWRKTAVERQQEMLHAYVDEALSANERRQFEAMLADDADLRAELAQIRQMKAHLRQMPRRRVPRNFTMDPAVYGRPQRQPLFQLYPVMRTAM
ncbi:MAG: anti-sigma factor family protein, partial [Anaerolineae bacterium]